jgi:DNA replication protein DnaC
MKDPCPICGDSGMRLVVRENGERYAQECECRHANRGARLLARAKIPPRYEHCSIDSYDTDFPGADPSLAAAHLMARKFVDGYPVATEGRGLLITGSIGVGKTHLAVGILDALVTLKGARGLFCDYRELLKDIQHSYNPQVATTELQILEPVFKAEVLVLDELGAQRPTEWIWDTVALVLNTRYNKKLTTIITTNYPDKPAATSGGTAASRAMREESLGDRIGERMRSRLTEMCVTVEMSGKDLRSSVRKARFG